MRTTMRAALGFCLMLSIPAFAQKAEDTTITTNVADSGTNGDVIMSSPAPYTSTGVLLLAKPSWPFITAKTGTADAGSAFTVNNSADAELLRVRGDGLVGIGTNNPGAKLHVFGSEMFLQNMPATSTGESVTMFTMANRAASGGSYMWRFATASSNGGSGIFPNALDLYEYPANASMHCCLLRMAVRPVNVPSPKLIVIDGAGNFGIGAWSPSQALHVNGNGLVEGNLNVTGTITGGNVTAHYQDLAEWVPSKTDVPVGTVVVLNPEKDNEVMPSANPYDSTVAGVVSEQPGVLLGHGGASKEMVATTGRVRVRVDATKAPIKVGDLLVTSSRPGMAMKSEPVQLGGRSFHQPGTIIGKALQPLASGEGEILVLLSLQ